MDHNDIDFSKLDYSDRPGFIVRMSHGAEFTIFAISVHYHSSSEDEPCYERKTISVTIGNFSFILGLFRKYEMPYSH